MSPLAAAVFEHASALSERELARRSALLRSLLPDEAEEVADVVHSVGRRVAWALVKGAAAEPALATALASIYEPGPLS